MNALQGRVPLTPEVDEEGFLLKPETWSKEVAQILAQKEMPKGLTEEHWKVIDYMRQYYLRTGSVPPLRMLSRDVGLSLRNIRELFPNGLTYGACRLAGLPRVAIRPSFLYP